MAKSATPEQLANYSKLHDEAVAKLLTIKDDPKWELSSEEQEIKFYKLYIESSPFAAAKSVVTIPDTTLEEVKKVLLPITIVDDKTPEKQRHGLDYCYELSGNGTDYNLFVTATASPGPLVSGREFILYRKMVEKDGLLIAINISIPDDDLVPENKKHVRAFMDYQGFIAKVSEQNPKDVELSFYVHADPKGSLPSLAYNAVVTKQGYAAKGVRGKIIKDHEAK